MNTCTFFGHRDCPENVKPALYGAIEALIREHGVDMFYVGNQGSFDAYVRGALRRLQVRYPHIRYAVVLAYMPGRKREYEDDSDTMFPEGLESVHPRYAVAWRNKWMLRRSDYVISYVDHSWGGAARYVDMARRQGKKVIAL